jgi:hypothetical protein
MLLWIYPILASRFATRFVTILGKKRGPKGNNHWKKTNRNFSRFDTNLVKRERIVTERGGKGALKNVNLGRERQNRALTYNQTRSCPVPRVPFYQPHATRPHTTRPHTSARNGQLNGNFPIRAPSKNFRQGLGKNWEKTKELGKTEYN